MKAAQAAQPPAAPHPFGAAPPNRGNLQQPLALLRAGAIPGGQTAAGKDS
jgi:hypothetical protein